MDMMAENTDVNVKDKERQSKDYSNNFCFKNTSMPITDDSVFKCWCHEVFIPNQRPERCSPGSDETPSASERNSISSIDSFDSGYDSKRCTRIFAISEFDECNKQNPL
ncbi:uncharacterized protein zgc:194007 isoform X2 [Onychostoma macrolepis]|uniref:uncharacterized protein zgc:194007 isoform X2 n=1 Tax=Onychostoma macrolepis TaxID=369639 RepID=UPI00272B406A|nr:uncharacterized protein zgc:194007 isoform X2 [Onychostoma macrolepis]